MKAIYGLYSDPNSAQSAVDRLRRAGVPDRAITVISSQPFEEYQFSRRDKPTWIFWIAACGGAAGMGFGFLLAYWTETLWPLVTGGMPIVAMFPNIIIMFEMTMMGAIVSTVLSLFVMTELPSVRSHVYDPEVSNGKIMVAVEGPRTEIVSTIRKTFETTTDKIRTIG